MTAEKPNKSPKLNTSKVANGGLGSIGKRPTDSTQINLKIALSTTRTLSPHVSLSLTHTHTHNLLGLGSNHPIQPNDPTFREMDQMGNSKPILIRNFSAPKPTNQPKSEIWGWESRVRFTHGVSGFEISEIHRIVSTMIDSSKMGTRKRGSMMQRNSNELSNRES